MSIIAAVVLALVGTWIILVYVTSADERAQAGAELTRVLVAAEDVEPGVPAGELDGRVREASMLAGTAEQASAVRRLAELGDQETRVQILEGQQIIQAQFGPPGQGDSPGTSDDVPEGLEVLSVVLSRERAVGGRIEAGSRVGVLMSIDAVDPEDGDTGAGDSQARTAMALNNVRVVRVAGGQQSGEGSDDSSDGGSVTVWLAVTPAQAERIVFAQTNGSIWLTDQGEGTVRPPDTDLRDQENIFQGIDESITDPGDTAGDEVAEDGDG